MKEKIEFIKSNLALIILVPTMLGGIWQLLELINISLSFIRFFSVSQLTRWFINSFHIINNIHLWKACFELEFKKS